MSLLAHVFPSFCCRRLSHFAIYFSSLFTCVNMMQADGSPGDRETCFRTAGLHSHLNRILEIGQISFEFHPSPARFSHSFRSEDHTSFEKKGGDQSICKCRYRASKKRDEERDQPLAARKSDGVRRKDLFPISPSSSVSCFSLLLVCSIALCWRFIYYPPCYSRNTAILLRDPRKSFLSLSVVHLVLVSFRWAFAFAAFSLTAS